MKTSRELQQSRQKLREIDRIGPHVVGGRQLLHAATADCLRLASGLKDRQS